MSKRSVYRVVAEGAFRTITAKLNPALKELITPDLKLTGPISIGGNYQRIELNYSIENDVPILRFKISKEANDTSAIEVLIRIAEDLLTNMKMRVQ